MSSKIFEEAIADAKKLREVAEDNAKKAILEAVAPRIREFIEDQLLEQGEEEEDEPKDDETKDAEEVVLDEASLRSLVTMLGGENILNSLKESNTSNALKASVQAAVSTLSSRQRKKLLEIADKINNSADILENNRINNKVVKNEEKSDMARNNFYEVDLRSLREALEEEAGGVIADPFEEVMDVGANEGGAGIDPSMLEQDAEDSDPEDDEGKDEGMSDRELAEMLNELRIAIDLGDQVEEDMLPPDLQGMLLPEEEGAEVEEEEGEEDLEGEEEGDDDMGEMDFGMEPGDEEEPPAADESFYVDANMLAEELNRVKRSLREGNMEGTWGGKGSGKAGVKNSYGGSGKKNLGYKNAFGGGSWGSDAFENPPQMNKLNEALRKQRRMNRALGEKLNKYRSAVETLREQLEDLNLFNAKLLYVNKLLQNKSLNESEKKSIIKALDESRSLNEAKSLYKSLTETLTRGSRGTLNESRRLGSSSRTTTSSSSKGRATSELDRWQTLAGLR